MRISDWSSDVCSSDPRAEQQQQRGDAAGRRDVGVGAGQQQGVEQGQQARAVAAGEAVERGAVQRGQALRVGGLDVGAGGEQARAQVGQRSEEHTSELQSLMRISYAVLCLKKKIIK